MSQGHHDAHDLHHILEAQEHELGDYTEARPGQLLRLGDGQEGVVCEVRAGAGLRLVRIAYGAGKVQPLGETAALSPAELAELAPLTLLGAWFAPETTPPPERILIEAIRRGFITAHNCGVPWPLSATMQLSEQAAAAIERYLFEVARSTGCAFPFHDIAEAMRTMHLCQRPDNPALCDILESDELSRHRKPHEGDLLSFWARELKRRIHASDWVPPTL